MPLYTNLIIRHFQYINIYTLGIYIIYKYLGNIHYISILSVQVLEVPNEDILVCGTADPLADVRTQARLVRLAGIINRASQNQSPKAPQREPEANGLPSRSRGDPPPCHRPPRGHLSGRFQHLSPRARTIAVDGAPTGLGLHGQGDQASNGVGLCPAVGWSSCPSPGFIGGETQLRVRGQLVLGDFSPRHLFCSVSA